MEPSQPQPTPTSPSATLSPKTEDGAPKQSKEMATVVPSVPTAARPYDPSENAAVVAGGTGVRLIDGQDSEALSSEGMKAIGVSGYVRENGVTRPRFDPPPEKLTTKVADGELFDSDGKWHPTETVANQELLFPSTVRRTDFAVELLDMAREEDRRRYAQMAADVRSGQLEIINEIRQQPDPGLLNFRFLVITNRKEYMTVSPKAPAKDPEA